MEEPDRDESVVLPRVSHANRWHSQSGSSVGAEPPDVCPSALLPTAVTDARPTAGRVLGSEGVRSRLADPFDAEPVDLTELDGGTIGTVSLAACADRDPVVANTGETPLSAEAAMLGALAPHLPVPEVYHATDDLLVLERVSGESTFSPAAERDAAERLADLHAATADALGFERDTLTGPPAQPPDRLVARVLPRPPRPARRRGRAGGRRTPRRPPRARAERRGRLRVTAPGATDPRAGPRVAVRRAPRRRTRPDAGGAGVLTPERGPGGLSRLVLRLRLRADGLAGPHFRRDRVPVDQFREPDPQ